jgi:hypothetical protein
MSRTCTICTNEQRATIEAAIVAGTPYRDIALQFSVGHMSVARHADGHIAEAISQAQEAKDEAQALDVVKQLKVINSVTLNILKEARTAKESTLALQAIDRVHKQLELQAKLLGNLDERPVINVLLTPEWVTIRQAITSALAPYGEAREAVALALMSLEGVTNGHRN